MTAQREESYCITHQSYWNWRRYPTCLAARAAFSESCEKPNPRAAPARPNPNHQVDHVGDRRGSGSRLSNPREAQDSAKRNTDANAELYCTVHKAYWNWHRFPTCIRSPGASGRKCQMLGRRPTRQTSGSGQGLGSGMERGIAVSPTASTTDTHQHSMHKSLSEDNYYCVTHKSYWNWRYRPTCMKAPRPSSGRGSRALFPLPLSLLSWMTVRAAQQVLHSPCRRGTRPKSTRHLRYPEIRGPAENLNRSPSYAAREVSSSLGSSAFQRDANRRGQGNKWTPLATNPKNTARRTLGPVEEGTRSNRSKGDKEATSRTEIESADIRPPSKGVGWLPLIGVFGLGILALCIVLLDGDTDTESTYEGTAAVGIAEFSKVRATALLEPGDNLFLKLQVRDGNWKTLKRARIADPQLGKCYRTSESVTLGMPRSENRPTQTSASLCIGQDGAWTVSIRQTPQGSALSYSLVPTSLVRVPRESVHYVGLSYTPAEERLARSEAATSAYNSGAMSRSYGSSSRPTPSRSIPSQVSAGSSTSAASATIARIIDGDTIEVRNCATCSTYRIRLANVWAPETHEPGGSTATSRLRSLIPPGTRVTFTRTQSDSYGRKVGNVSVSGTSVNSRMRSYGYTSNSSNSSSSGSTRSTTFSGSSRSTGSSYSGSCDTSQRTYRGSPGYHPSQDRDNDGIGCECGCGRR